MTVQIGRLTLPDNPAISHTPGGISLSVRFAGASLAATVAIAAELGRYCAAEGSVIPVTWDGDAVVDGFYRIAGGTVSWQSMVNEGYATAAFQLEHVGTESSVQWQAVLDGGDLTNDHGFSSGSGLVSPPRTHEGYWPMASGTKVTRAGSAGTIYPVIDVAVADHPRWYTTPAGFYTGGCQVKVGGYIRVGTIVPNDPTDFEISNELVRITDGGSGTLDVEHYDGTDWRSIVWTPRVAGAAIGADWERITVVRNDAERVVVRFDRRRGSLVGLITMYVGLRRGSRNVDGVIYNDRAATSIGLQSGVAGVTTATPTGSMRQSGTTDGHRWLVGSEITTTITTASGRIELTGARLPFIISREVDEGGGVASGDAVADLWAQYMGWRGETVVPVVAA